MFHTLDVFPEAAAAFEVDGEKIGELHAEPGSPSRDEEGRSSTLSPFSRAEVLTLELSELRFFILECWMRLTELPGISGLQGHSIAQLQGPLCTALLEHNSRWCHSHRIQLCMAGGVWGGALPKLCDRGPPPCPFWVRVLFTSPAAQPMNQQYSSEALCGDSETDRMISTVNSSWAVGTRKPELSPGMTGLWSSMWS